MQELMKFEDNNVEIIQDKNGNLLFEIYSTGMALGYARNNGKSGGEHGVHPKLFPYKSRIDKIISNAEITPCVHNGHSYLNESQLYDFMLEARTDKCRKFRKWVTNEVLPSINKTGSYSVSNSPQLPYSYVNKTYRARPIITASDISNIFGLNQITLYNFIKTKLTPTVDYDVIQGETLKDYIKENPDVPHCRKSMFVIYNTGLSRIAFHFDLDTTKIPKFMTEKRGYVVHAEVRKLMEFVRRELKGIESLTYLVESDDKPCNLENYRKILVQKLANIQWWQMDVSHVKLGVHNVTGTELSNIHNAVYGMKY